MDKPNTEICQFRLRSYPLTVICPSTAEPQPVRQALADKIKQGGLFLHNAPVVIDVSNLERIHEDDVRSLIDTCQRKHFVPVGLIGPKSSQLEAVSSAVGLSVLGQTPLDIPSDDGDATPTADSAPSEGTKKPEKARAGSGASIGEAKTSPRSRTQIIDQPVRSGQQFYNPHGDIIVQASVNPGAEIVAAGSIHIYGKLKGKALAGALGDESARIYTQGLEAQLVSIGGQYRMMDAQSELHGEAAVIQLTDGQLEVRPLTS